MIRHWSVSYTHLRFYIEKFEGNVLREFYPEGALKSEAEVKEGKRHGRYREYHENGKLKLRGKYSNNQPKGTWKYYTCLLYTSP